jgi:hypothetical protein
LNPNGIWVIIWWSFYNVYKKVMWIKTQDCQNHRTLFNIFHIGLLSNVFFQNLQISLKFNSGQMNNQVSDTGSSVVHSCWQLVGARILLFFHSLTYFCFDPSPWIDIGYDKNNFDILIIITSQWIYFVSCRSMISDRLLNA